MVAESLVSADAHALGNLLLALGHEVRDRVIANRDLETDHKEHAFQGGDTVFRIDKLAEAALVEAIEAWPKKFKPLRVIAEGMAETDTLIGGAPDTSPRYSLLVDPIDGTRGLMYDKRSAWFLAAAVPQCLGEELRLSNAVASALVELPTSKQYLADCFLMIDGQPSLSRRQNLLTGEESEIIARPSTATTLRNGFAQVSNFFPGTKVLAADLMERISTAVQGPLEEGRGLVFDDQYISTGGQLVELMMGRDRFCCDLRPLLYEILSRRRGVSIARGLVCHPYDLAGAPAVEAAGVILTDGFGARLDAPLDLTSPVHWCGYANRSLYEQIAPVIRAWLEEHFS